MFASDETQPPCPGVELAPLKWDFTCARRARAPWHALVGELWGRKHLEVSPSVVCLCLSGGLYRSVLLCLGLQVSIGSPEKMEPITKVSHIPSSRWALVCSLCNEKFGASIQVISSVGTV